MGRFDLTLRPPPPLGAHSALVVLGATALVMLLGAIRFLALGAWPVLPFMVVDVAILVWAFRASARNAHAYERVRLDEQGLVVRKVAPNGRARTFRMEPRLTRVELESLSPPENRLWLVYRNSRLVIGRFLSPRERSEVYDVIARCLNG
jgi:uncharacterized membrane protein